MATLEEIFGNNQQPNKPGKKSLEEIFSSQVKPSQELTETITQPKVQQKSAPFSTGASGVATGAGKGILSTITGLGSLGERGLRFLTKPLFGGKAKPVSAPTSIEEFIPDQIRKPQTSAEKAGFTTEQLAEFALPLPGTKVKAAKGLTGLLTKGVKEGVEFGAKTAAQKGTIDKEIGLSTVIGSVSPFATKALSLLGKGINRLVKPVTGAVRESGKSILRATTSVPEKAISLAAKQPRAVRVGFDKNITATTVRDEAVNAFNNVRNAANKAFSQGIKKLEKVNLSPLEKAEVKAGLRDIENSFIEKAKDFGIKFDGNKIKSFPLKLDSAAQKNIINGLQRIKKQKDFSPKGLQSLAEDIQSLRKFTAADLKSKSTPLVGSLIDDVSSFIRKNKNSSINELGKLRSDFAKTKKMLNEADSVLEATRGKIDNKKMRSSVSKLTNLFREDNDIYLDALKALEKSSGQKFLSKLAGTEFQRISPGILRTSLAVGNLPQLAAAGAVGTASYFNPIALMLIPLFSPRAVGGLITNTAKSRQLLEELFKIGTGSEVLPTQIRGLINRIITGQLDMGKDEDVKTLEEIFSQ